MEYRKEIDGLRAVAVIPVILFHAGFPGFSGGYVGVDIFFVISGYLITSILLKELSNGSFSILRFYERRARRIFPALFFVMACCVPFAYAWMTPEQYKEFSQAVVAISFFASNLLFWSKSDYFAPDSELNPLLHTWSLAVEEQFYIFFPVVLLTLWRFGKNPVFYAVVILSVSSLLLSEWGWRNSPNANFYLLPTRAWELGIGALCAFILRDKILENNWLSILGLSLILYSIAFFNDATPFPSLYALIPVSGTALIILFGSKNSISAKLLSYNIIVGVGLVSFSAYLWHQPLLAFARLRSPTDPSLSLMLALCLASLILAAFSWKFVEQPFRKRSFAFSKTQRQIFTNAALGSGAFLLLGFWGHWTGGLPDRVAPSGRTFAELNIGEKLKANNGLSKKCNEKFTTSPECRTGDSPQIMLWGDSYAMHLVQAIQASPSLGQVEVIQFTKSSCPPIVGLSKTDLRLTRQWAEGCIAFNDSVVEWLKENSSVKYVVLSSPMNIIQSNTYDFNGKYTAPSPEVVMEALNHTASVVRESGKSPIFISPPPVTGSDLSRCPAYSLIFLSTGDVRCSITLDFLDPAYVEVMNFLEDDDMQMPLIKLSDYLCDEKSCNTFPQGINIYRDTSHLSIAGSQWLGISHDVVRAIFDTGKNLTSP